ncbi:MAG: RNA-binding protein [Chloroflexi bacterium]|jgi:RNA recognition motif-containing protein|uniref:RRM domain-containing protein n=1 Tax=marine metagenome TaxID=408172 RepID=A0A382VLS0_9ZZZZ|nr:RNA-binding protein [Chloroflexota bacterium]|tara:strand:- start:1047 stop:1289 length:243 start_codon:yes stop_codon:yes gene_type:complete
MDIYVGNLPWSIDDDGLKQLFEEHGEVSSAKVIKDRETNRSRGFGFVSMDDDAAETAISSLDGSEVDGRNLKVNKSKGKS